jgi:hypothetical protein
MISSLQSAELWEHSFPFRHYRAKNLLSQEAYDNLSSAFTEILETTAGKRDGPYRLTRSNKNYDALMLGIDQTLASVFTPFFSPDWLESLSEFFSIPFVPKIDGGLHSSPANSRTGWIHTDYCAGWFDESVPSNGMLSFPDRTRCEYFTGRALKPDALPRQYIRAATLIFYLCNDHWVPEDGGETGIYGARTQTPQTDAEFIPPINNTLLIFRCSPHSYHRFITNPGRARNSIILWLHSTPGYAASRWSVPTSRI